MAGHAQLKFVMTECSKTQIRLTGLIHGFIGTNSKMTINFRKARQNVIVLCSERPPYTGIILAQNFMRGKMAHIAKINEKFSFSSEKFVLYV